MSTNAPTPEQIQALIERGPDGPIVMVNLLKYSGKAHYPAGKPEAGENLSGREAYRRYGAAVTPILAKVGAAIVYGGEQKLAIIGGAGEDWDEVVLVRYPSRQIFLGMAMSAEYQAIAYHREAALERSALLCTTEGLTP